MRLLYLGLSLFLLFVNLNLIDTKNLDNYILNENKVDIESSKNITPPSRSLPYYEINLDDDPSIRFKQVLEDFKQYRGMVNEIIDKLFGYYQYLLRPLLYFRNENPEYLSEMKAAAEAFETDFHKIFSIIKSYNRCTSNFVVYWMARI